MTSLELSVASASVAAPSAMEASATETPAMEAAKAGLSSEGIGSGNPSMIEPTEGAGMHARLCVRVKSLMAPKTLATGIGATTKVPGMTKASS